MVAWRSLLREVGEASGIDDGIDGRIFLIVECVHDV